MPKIRKSLRDLSVDQELWLMDGPSLLCKLMPFASDEEARQTWEDFREHIMHEWMADKNNLRDRPFAFWKYDAIPEIRRGLTRYEYLSRQGLLLPGEE